MRPARSVKHLSESLHLADCHDGFWLYDDTRGQNLAIREKTGEDALVKALMFYQKRLLEVESSYSTLKNQVDVFCSQFIEKEGEEAA